MVMEARKKRLYEFRNSKNKTPTSDDKKSDN